MYTQSRTRWYALVFHRTPSGRKIIKLGDGVGPGQITTWSYTKNVSGSAGRLNFTSVPDHHYHYHEIIDENTPVVFVVDNGMKAEPNRGIRPEGVFIGFVDRVSQPREIGQDGTPRMQSLWTCRDATKLFELTSLTSVSHTKRIDSLHRLVGLLQANANVRGSIQKGRNNETPVGTVRTPTEYLYLFLSAYLRQDINNIDLVLPRGTPGASDLNFLRTIDVSRFVYSDANLFQFGKEVFYNRAFSTTSTLWELLRRYSHPLFNEFFIDVRHWDEIRSTKGRMDSRGNSASAYQKSAHYRYGQPNSAPMRGITKIFQEQRYSKHSSEYFTSPLRGKLDQPEKWQIRLILRPRPYLSRDLLSTYTVHLRPQDLTAKDLGRGGYDIRNMFRVEPLFANSRFGDVYFKDKGRQISSYVNFPSVYNHGLRPFLPSSDFVASLGENSKKATNGIIENARIQSEILAAQHYRNGTFLSGSINTAVTMPCIRPGMALQLEDKNDPMVFYIESTTHQGAFTQEGPRTSTSMGLVRGARKSVLVSGEDSFFDPRTGKFRLNVPGPLDGTTGNQIRAVYPGSKNRPALEPRALPPLLKGGSSGLG